MGEIEINPIAVLISFIIWLDIDITVFRNFIKQKYKTKSQKFIEKAKAKGNYVIGREVNSKYNSSWTDDDGHYHEEYYKVTYEYVVNGKIYKKKLKYTDNKYPSEQNIYYKPGKPRKSIAETETKFGFMYIMAWFCIPLSIFLGIPISSWVITGIINMF